MDTQNDPKPTIEQMVDHALNPSVEQREEKVASTEQQAEASVSTGEVQKTQEPVQQPETDKGFASHPAWQAREAKLKEAREALAAKEAEAQRYAKLLDELQKRPQQVTQQVDKQAQALSLAEQACKLKGWDINRLTPEQRDVVNDQVELITAVLEIQRKNEMSELDKRLAPLEQARQRYEQEQAMAQAESKWASLASEDKLDVKVVQAAINKYCEELDERDPQRTIKLSDEDLYYRATRPLLREKEVSQVRQEARDAVKVNARPLGRAPQAQVADEPNKPKKPLDFLEKQLDGMGVR